MADQHAQHVNSTSLRANNPLGNEKTTIGFFADILQVQGIIPFEMYQDILDAKTHDDLEDIVERLLRSEYNVFKRGENRILTGG